MKSKQPVHIIFGVVTGDGDVIIPFIFPHGSSPNMQASIKWIEEVVFLRIEWWLLKDPGEPNIGYEKSSATSPSLTSVRLTSSDYR